MFGGGIINACYWDNNQEQGIGVNQGGSDVEATKVADGNWTNAVTQMNAALNESNWKYELTGALPTLKKNQ